MERPLLVKGNPALPPHPLRLAVCMLLLAVTMTASQAERRSELVPKEASVKPSVTIPLQQLGFVPPAASMLLQRVAGTTLNFIDSDRLLFTFHQPGLLKRATDAQPDDDDQLIHAEIVNIASRQVETATDWRMHDRDRFLWPMGGGKFLVRQRDSLFRTDASLRLQPYAQFPGVLRSVQLSPDGKILVAETEEAPAKPTAGLQGSEGQSSGTGTQPSDAAGNEATLPIMVRIINLDTKTMLARTRARLVPKVPTIEGGFLEELRGNGNRWLITYKGFDGTDRKIAEIGSTCSPTLQFLSTYVALIITCDHSSKDRLLTAVGLDGKTLWDRKTDSRRIWPAFSYAEDGSRFALATLVLDHAVSAIDPFDRGDVLGQVVEVFDTRGGESRLVAPASPVLDSGQNFALAADGHKFAILHNDAIEIYDIK